MKSKTDILNLAKRIKDEDAITLLEHAEDFPDDWVQNAKDRLAIKRKQNK